MLLSLAKWLPPCLVFHEGLRQCYSPSSSWQVRREKDRNVSKLSDRPVPLSLVKWLLPCLVLLLGLRQCYSPSGSWQVRHEDRNVYDLLDRPVPLSLVKWLLPAHHEEREVHSFFNLRGRMSFLINILVRNPAIPGASLPLMIRTRTSITSTAISNGGGATHQKAHILPAHQPHTTTYNNTAAPQQPAQAVMV